MRIYMYTHTHTYTHTHIYVYRLRDASVEEAKVRHEERCSWDEERRLWQEVRERERVVMRKQMEDVRGEGLDTGMFPPPHMTRMYPPPHRP